VQRRITAPNSTLQSKIYTLRPHDTPFLRACQVFWLTFGFQNLTLVPPSITGAPLLNVPAGGTREPLSPDVIARKRHTIQMRGREVFKFAVTIMGEVSVRRS